MNPAIRRLLVRILVLLAFLAPFSAARAGHGANSDDRTIALGAQPLAFPLSMYTEVIKHDRILREQLSASGWKLREHPYIKGNDMIEQIDTAHLDALALGDIPTLNAVARHDLVIVGMLKHTFSSVVANRYMPLAELKGKRIGNGLGSTAHYTLLEGLAAAGLKEADVRLVETNVNDMPAALEAGRIDAFSAWEPAPTIALARNPNYFVVYRGVNNSYLTLRRPFVEQHPEVARQFVAAFARALYWMKRSPDNLRQAARWALRSIPTLTGKPPGLSEEQAMAITRREALEVPGLPILSRNEATPNGRMAKQLVFLKQQGKLPDSVGWDQIATRFAPHLLEDALHQPARYRVHAFDYDP